MRLQSRVEPDPAAVSAADCFAKHSVLTKRRLARRFSKRDKDGLDPDEQLGSGAG